MSKIIASPEDKPNVEYEDPAAKPNAEDRASGPAGKVIFGRGGPGGFIVLGLVILLFILAGGSIFYFLG